jgi:hypothetical protein
MRIDHIRGEPTSFARDGGFDKVGRTLSNALLGLSKGMNGIHLFKASLGRGR